MTITTLTTRVPVLLDVDEMNYSSLMYFFQNLCRGYNLLEHILGASKDDTTPSDSTPPTTECLTIDSIVLTWIFMTLSKTLQQRLVVENPKTRKEAWDILELIFNDNKRSRSIALKADDVRRKRIVDAANIDVTQAVWAKDLKQQLME
ncbi:hypothetical protein Tco_1374460 [Tanacetum coccineum]